MTTLKSQFTVLSKVDIIISEYRRKPETPTTCTKRFPHKIIRSIKRLRSMITKSQADRQTDRCTDWRNFLIRYSLLLRKWQKTTNRRCCRTDRQPTLLLHRHRRHKMTEDSQPTLLLHRQPTDVTAAQTTNRRYCCTDTADTKWQKTTNRRYCCTDTADTKYGSYETACRHSKRLLNTFSEEKGS